MKKIFSTLVLLSIISNCGMFASISFIKYESKPDDGNTVIADTVITKKVMVIIYNPILESKGGKRLTEFLKWNDPNKLIDDYIKDVKQSSWNIVHYQVVYKFVLDEYPWHVDGYRYNDSTYLYTWYNKKWHDTGGDYRKIINDFKIVEKVEKKIIDEVWLFGAPGFSWWESTMAGNGSYYCNSDPVPNINSKRAFIIMGFNYERGVDCMLEDLGHRTESIMSFIYGGWNVDENNPWNKFTLYDKVLQGKAQCGNVHFSPNSTKDYEWGNKTAVISGCDDWFNYPNLTGKTRVVSCDEWGNGDMRLHHIWWFKHLPKAVGTTNGKLNNWWKYIMNYDEYISN